MADLESDAGSLGDVGRLDEDWGFTLYDTREREVAAFVYESEKQARQAHKMIQAAIVQAIAVVAAIE